VSSVEFLIMTSFLEILPVLGLDHVFIITDAKLHRNWCIIANELVYFEI